MSKVAIFSVGTVGMRRAAMREDGQWFMRHKDAQGHWQRWTKFPGRPEHAWYNPNAGKARLPKEEEAKHDQTIGKEAAAGVESTALYVDESQAADDEAV